MNALEEYRAETRAYEIARARGLVDSFRLGYLPEEAAAVGASPEVVHAVALGSAIYTIEALLKIIEAKDL